MRDTYSDTRETRNERRVSLRKYSRHGTTFEENMHTLKLVDKIGRFEPSAEVTGVV